MEIVPFLWFDLGKADEAVAFYRSVFPDLEVLEVTRYGDAGPARAGTTMTTLIRIAGQKLALLNGGPQFTFTMAFSLAITCEEQAQVDELWAKLPAGGGETHQCGWLTDKFGLTWQVVPKGLIELLHAADERKGAAAMRAMMRQEKLDLAAVQRAYDAA